MNDLAILLKALGSMFEPVLELAEEQGSDGEAGYIPPWGTLFDPLTVPLKDIPYLAQYVGVTIPSGASEVEARALLTAESGLERGTLRAVELAVKRSLGPNAPFSILERTNLAGETNKAYNFLVIIPVGGGAAGLAASIEAVKPGGLMFNIVEVADRFVEGKLKWSGIAAGKKWSEMVEGAY